MSNDKQESFATRFPNRIGVIGTHTPECYKSHPSCAYLLGVKDALASHPQLKPCDACVTTLKDPCHECGGTGFENVRNT